MYEFKNITIPKEHGFDDEQLKFLQTIDEAMEKAKEQTSKKEDIETIKTDLETQMKALKDNFNYDKMQEQINAVFIKLNDMGVPTAAMTKEQAEGQALKHNNEWIRGLLTKDKARMTKAATELKTLDPILHLGPATGTDAGDLALDMSEGGYLIPELFDAEIRRFVIEGGVARREMGYMPFSGAGNDRYLNYQLTNVAVTWIDEAEIKGKTNPTTARIHQVLKTVAAISILTEDIVEDAAYNLVSWVGQLIGEAIAAEEDDQFFAGTGAPWTGILSTAGVVGLNLAANVGPLTLRPEALLAPTVAIPAGAVVGAKFYMHRTVWAAISARRSDSVAAADSRGTYLVQNPSQSSPGSIWGFPIVLVEAMPSMADLYGVTDMTDIDPDLTLSENDEPFIIFGNLQKTCVYGDKGGLRVKLLDQATVTDSGGNLINLAEQDMLAVRVHKRVGFAVVLAAGLCVISTGETS